LMPKRKAKPDPRYAEQPTVGAPAARRYDRRDRESARAAATHGALDPQQARFEGRVELKRTKVEGRAGTIYRAPPKRTSSRRNRSARSAGAASTVATKREEGIVELIQIIWQIRIPAASALHRRKGVGRPGPALAQAPGCP